MACAGRRLDRVIVEHLFEGGNISRLALEITVSIVAATRS
jgi:hypothetical protein